MSPTRLHVVLVSPVAPGAGIAIKANAGPSAENVISAIKANAERSVLVAGEEATPLRPAREEMAVATAKGQETPAIP